MADPRRATDGDDGACWQCGAPAREECAYPLKLVARAGRDFDAMGYSVTPGRGLDTVVVRVPRCAACRGRGQESIVILFASMIAGAIIAPILQSLFWPNVGPPSWMQILTHRHAPVGAVSAIGAVVGALAAILGVSWQRRRLGLRALNAYPPVLALKRAGWREPSS